MHYNVCFLVSFCSWCAISILVCFKTTVLSRISIRRPGVVSNYYSMNVFSIPTIISTSFISRRFLKIGGSFDSNAVHFLLSTIFWTKTAVLYLGLCTFMNCNKSETCILMHPQQQNQNAGSKKLVAKSNMFRLLHSTTKLKNRQRNA